VISVALYVSIASSAWFQTVCNECAIRNLLDQIAHDAGDTAGFSEIADYSANRCGRSYETTAMSFFLTRDERKTTAEIHDCRAVVIGTVIDDRSTLMTFKIQKDSNGQSTTIRLIGRIE
jgi:hypothetical protein